VPPRRDVVDYWVAEAAKGMPETEAALNFYAPVSERIRQARAELREGSR
jgi:hypothetical protein